jgi:hypothetical protein
MNEGTKQAIIAFSILTMIGLLVFGTIYCMDRQIKNDVSINKLYVIESIDYPEPFLSINNHNFKEQDDIAYVMMNDAGVLINIYFDGNNTHPFPIHINYTLNNTSMFNITVYENGTYEIKNNEVKE